MTFYLLPEAWDEVETKLAERAKGWHARGEFWSFEEVRKTCLQPSAIFIDAQAVVLLLKTSTDWELLFVGVEPESRKAGIGFRALNMVMQEIRGSKMFLEVASSNLAAQKLYKKCGFNVVRTRAGYYKNGDDGLIMEVRC